jgi:hypothetical protein
MSTGVLVAGRGCWGEAVPVDAMVVACAGVKTWVGLATDAGEVQAVASGTSRISKQANFLIGSILAQMTGLDPGVSW